MYKDYPTTEYNSQTVSNILIRTNLINNLNNSYFFENYTIKDSDTPESLSKDVYDDTKYSYIILTINKMFNRFFDWPLAGFEFQNYVENKYNYSSIFLAESQITFPLSSVDKIQKSNNAIFYVQSSDRNLNVLNLKTKISESSLTSGMVVTLLDKQNNIIKNNVTLGRCVYEGANSLYNFSENEKILDARNSNFNYLSAYIASSEGVNSIITTNYKNEETLNNNKRNIVILKNRFLGEYLSLNRNILDIKANIYE